MDVLVSLAPIALIVLVCGGMHFWMMRGTHGGAAHGDAHDMHANRPQGGNADAEKLRQLESEVASLREQVAGSREGDRIRQDLARMHGSVDVGYRDDLIRRFQLDQRKKVRALSKGNRQKVQLIAALATRADLLVLDEPTSGLDPLMEVVFRQTVLEAKGRGQAVFLSSHILSEVEALCDRIGILREGRLVDEGSLAELRHLKAQTIELTFGGVVPELPALPGITVQPAGANTLRCEVTGSVEPLLAAIAGKDVVSLRTREPSLEEIFLHYYGSADAGTR